MGHSKNCFRVNLYLIVVREKVVADIPVTQMSFEDILKLEDECTVSLGVPTGVLGAPSNGKARSARRIRTHVRAAKAARRLKRSGRSMRAKRKTARR
jgi:hypothetical protein